MNEWIAQALQLGIDAAQPIHPGQVVLAEWVRLKCQFGCGRYGQSLT